MGKMSYSDSGDSCINCHNKNTLRYDTKKWKCIRSICKDCYIKYTSKINKFKLFLDRNLKEIREYLINDVHFNVFGLYPIREWLSRKLEIKIPNRFVVINHTAIIFHGSDIDTIKIYKNHDSSIHGGIEYIICSILHELAHSIEKLIHDRNNEEFDKCGNKRTVSYQHCLEVFGYFYTMFTLSFNKYCKENGLEWSSRIDKRYFLDHLEI